MKVIQTPSTTAALISQYPATQKVKDQRIREFQALSEKAETASALLNRGSSEIVIVGSRGPRAAFGCQ